MEKFLGCLHFLVVVFDIWKGGGNDGIGIMCKGLKGRRVNARMLLELKECRVAWRFVGVVIGRN